MEALSRLSPQTEVYGVEINEVAAHDIKTGNVFIENALEFNPPIKADLAFTKGLAIHIHPDNIQKLYERLYSVSEKYILMAEYYSPRREMIEYRGHKDKLWKASFYQEMMDAYPDLQLIGSGFVGHWDVFPQDDLTWWLWRKT
jgi:spore coat polysaccharide biosynthesis protein SpsF